MIITMKLARPRPGHEFSFYLAMKHRAITSELMSDETRGFWRSWRSIVCPKRYNRLFKLWEHALDQIREHGCDVVFRPDVVSGDE